MNGDLWTSDFSPKADVSGCVQGGRSWSKLASHWAPVPVMISVRATWCCILFLGSVTPGIGSREPLFPSCSVARHPFTSFAFLFFPPYFPSYIIVIISLCYLAILSVTNFLLFSVGANASLAFLRAGRWLMRHRVGEAVAGSTGNFALNKARTGKQDTDSIRFVFFPLNWTKVAGFLVMSHKTLRNRVHTLGLLTLQDIWDSRWNLKTLGQQVPVGRQLYN